MRKLVKAAIAVGACLVLTGCPKATSVTGSVTSGLSVSGVKVGDTLTPTMSYQVAQGASITVGYDNGKSCTFRGPISFLPGADGSVCEKKQDNDDKKQDQDQDQKQNQQDQARQDQPETGQGQEQASNGGTNATSGISAPEVTPTSVPDYSGNSAPAGTGSPTSPGIGGPQVIASAVPTFTRIMQVVNNPILTSTLSIIGAAAVVKEVHDQTNGDGDEPISK